MLKNVDHIVSATVVSYDFWFFKFLRLRMR